MCGSRIKTNNIDSIIDELVHAPAAPTPRCINAALLWYAARRISSTGMSTVLVQPLQACQGLALNQLLQSPRFHNLGDLRSWLSASPWQAWRGCTSKVDIGGWEDAKPPSPPRPPTPPNSPTITIRSSRTHGGGQLAGWTRPPLPPTSPLSRTISSTCTRSRLPTVCTHSCNPDMWQLAPTVKPQPLPVHR